MTVNKVREGKTITGRDVVDYFDENGHWIKRVYPDELTLEIKPWGYIDSFENWVKRVCRRDK